MKPKKRINPANSIALLATGLHVEIDKSTGTFMPMNKLQRFKFPNGFVCYAQTQETANQMHQEATKLIKKVNKKR